MNTLSSSETSNITQGVLDAAAVLDSGSVPLGLPVEGIDVRVVDEHGNDAPRGDIGEPVIRSDYLSPGYWRNAALTHDRFPQTLGGRDGRCFLTGDLGRWREDGSLEIAGRKDSQLKIRGHRVEVKEVEALLARHPAIGRAAAYTEEKSPGEARLSALVIMRSGCTSGADELRRSLCEILPDHLLPSVIDFVLELPLTPHGKLDRAALGHRRKTPPASPDRDPHATECGSLIAGIWADALRIDAVKMDDDFFALGGDSLSAAVAAAKLAKAFRVEIDLRTFATHATPNRMAHWLAKAAGEIAARHPLERAPRGRPLPLSFAQERYLALARTLAEAAAWTMAASVIICGPLDPQALKRCVDRIVHCHETFAMDDGQWTQTPQAAMPVETPRDDLSATPRVGARTREILQREARIPFDLATVPIVRFRLVRIGPREHCLLRVNHHVISDAWSWKIFFHELGTLYLAESRSEPAPLADATEFQYGDYALWQRHALAPGSAAHRRETEWWAQMLRGSTTSPALPFVSVRLSAPIWRRGKCQRMEAYDISEAGIRHFATGRAWSGAGFGRAARGAAG